MLRSSAIFLTLLLPALAQRHYTYVGNIGTDSATIAWGTTGTANTIGRDSKSHGKAIVRIGGNDVKEEEKNWVLIKGLHPDHDYPYEVILNGNTIGRGSVRTQPEKADKLAFLVIGDYGTGSREQHALAAVMADVVAQRLSTANPIRFVLTTGDNIYGKWRFRYYSTGDTDVRWEETFFAPYEKVLLHVPFYPTLGNHDGNGSEKQGDLGVYLDNFFFPGGRPARYYSFSFGGLADFFALDTTDNTETGPPRPAYGPDSEQFAWLKEELSNSKSLWRIAYFHHPPFVAGPRHVPLLEELRHIHEVLVKRDVNVVFNGHEHNFQFAERSQASGGILYVVSGSGGQLRSGKISGPAMVKQTMAGWARQRQFLLVEIQGRKMEIMPVGTEPIRVQGPDGKPLEMPIRVELKPAY
jgi:hypothetical protein